MELSEEQVYTEGFEDFGADMGEASPGGPGPCSTYTRRIS